MSFYVIQKGSEGDYSWSSGIYKIQPIETQDEFVLPISVINTPGIPEDLKASLEALTTKASPNWIVHEDE